jgi:preprotein translocase subunit YajC
LDQLILMTGQPASGEGGAGSMLVSLAPILLIFVIFYLLLIRPQQKKQTEHQKLLTALKKGDRVVTNSGMFGVISSINDEKNIVVLRVGDDVKMEFLKSSIAGKVEN